MASTIILSDNGVSSGSAGLKETGGNDGVLILQSTTSGGTATNALYIDNSQNVGLGTSSPVTMLDVRGEVSVAYNATYGLRFYNQDRNNWSSIGCNIATGSSSANLVFKDSTGEVARMTGGNLLVGTTTALGLATFSNTATSNFAVASISRNASGNAYCQYSGITGQTPNNTSSLFYYGSDATALRFAVYANGGIANYSANNSNLSDSREKTNANLAGDYLAKICAIPVRTYNYIDQNLEEDDGLTLGVFAQDVQAVAPELVTESDWSMEKDGSKMRLSIYQTDMQYALMKCIQEQQAIIETLTNRITALENK